MTMRSAAEKLDDYLNYINSAKKARSDQDMGLCYSHFSNEKRVLAPSGPRRPGEGVEDEEQGIITVETSEQGAVNIYITLLAAGFVIGPKGRSIHQICHISGADIRSWSTNFQTGSNHVARALRVFQIQGEKERILQALQIMVTAVDRYKELSEGKFEGYVVDKEQIVMGIEFYYQPPPKHAVPVAARIKSDNYSEITAGSEWEQGRPSIPQAQGVINMNYMMAHADALYRASVNAGQTNYGSPMYMRSGRCAPSASAQPSRTALGTIQVQQGVQVPDAYYQYVQYQNHSPPMYGYDSCQMQPAQFSSMQQAASQQVQGPSFHSADLPLPQPNAGYVGSAPARPLMLAQQFAGTTGQMGNYPYSPQVLPTSPSHFQAMPRVALAQRINSGMYNQMYRVDSIPKDATSSPTCMQEEFA